MSSLLTFIIPFFAAFLGVFFYNGSLSSPVFQFLTSYNQHPIAPHHASWNTWLNPSRAISEGSGVSRRRGWNIHHHLGGNGPWVEMIDDEEFRPRGIHPPEGCTVDQIHMVCSFMSLVSGYDATNRVADCAPFRKISHDIGRRS